MVLIFNTDFSQAFVAYLSTHFPTYLLLTNQLIYFSAHILVLAIEEKNNSDNKHIIIQDQTYCFYYLIAQKL